MVAIQAEELANVVGALAEANDALVAAVTAGDSDLAADLVARAGVLERRRNRLLRSAGAGSPRAYQAVAPLRDQVIRGLRLGSAPMSARLLADVARARFDDRIETTKLSSLRRDESASWQAAHGGGRAAARDVYVVPALTHDRFAPVRGALALSIWPLAERLVAPASPRVNMLRVTLSLADECGAAPLGASWLPKLSLVLARLARTVPGVPTGAPDLDTVRAAVRAELCELEHDDARERRVASERAEHALDEYTALFGTATAVRRTSAARGA